MTKGDVADAIAITALEIFLVLLQPFGYVGHIDLDDGGGMR